MSVEGLKTAAQKSVSSARPAAAFRVYPAGVCIHELATMIQKAESVAPTATIRIENQWLRRERRLRANR
jgi:hypothetical protein